MRDLGEIKVTPFAKSSDWEGYPDGFEAHPARNHPAFVRELIACWARPHEEAVFGVYDPQCGIGTVMIEAERLGLHGVGWDIDRAWRQVVPGRFLVTSVPPNGVGLIVTSPAYFGTNKPRGNTERQREIQASVGSSAGTEWRETVEGHLGGYRDRANWAWGIDRMMARCFEALAPGGHLVWIIRDKIEDGKPLECPQGNARLMERNGFELLGAHWRRLVPTANEQLRAAGAERAFVPGQGALLGGVVEFTPPPSIDRELAIVGRKP